MSLAALIGYIHRQGQVEEQKPHSGSEAKSVVIDWQCLPQVQKRTVMGQRATPLPSLYRALSLVLLRAGAERV